MLPNQSQVLKTRIDPAFCRCSSPAACFTFFRTCFFYWNCQQQLRLRRHCIETVCFVAWAPIAVSEAHALQSLLHQLCLGFLRFLQCVVASQAHLADPAIFWTLSRPFALGPWSHSQLPVLVASWIRCYLVAICEESSPAGERGMIKCFSKVQTGTCKKSIKKCCHYKYTIIHPWLWLVRACLARLANLKHPGSRHNSSM